MDVNLQWQSLLLDVAAKRTESKLVPAFPAESIQDQFVGSNSEHAMQEAITFYNYVMSYFRPAQGNEVTTALDFGCGWGRFTRIMAGDFDTENIFAVDVDSDIVAANIAAGVSARFSVVDNRDCLQLTDESIDFTIAYSVFTHLPKDLHFVWMKELARVTASGGLVALTTEPPRFLDFVQGLEVSDSNSGWHRAMSAHQHQIPALRIELARSGYVYLPTGGGAFRPSESYGEAVITEETLTDWWSESFEKVDFCDDSTRFWQAVAIFRKK